MIVAQADKAVSILTLYQKEVRWERLHLSACQEPGSLGLTP